MNNTFLQAVIDEMIESSNKKKNEDDKKEFIPGMTREEARKEFSGLKLSQAPLDISKVSSGQIAVLKKIKNVRRTHWNAPPRNFRPVSEEEAAKNFMRYSPVFTEYRQLLPWDEENNKVVTGGKTPWPWEREDYEGFVPEKRPYHSKGTVIPVTIFYMSDGTGWALSSDYWSGKIYWYRFGCEHEWLSSGKKFSTFSNQSLRYCKKCEYSEVIDSSD